MVASSEGERLSFTLHTTLASFYHTTASVAAATVSHEWRQLRQAANTCNCQPGGHIIAPLAPIRRRRLLGFSLLLVEDGRVREKVKARAKPEVGVDLCSLAKSDFDQIKPAVRPTGCRLSSSQAFELRVFAIRVNPPTALPGVNSPSMYFGSEGDPEYS